jgi:AraC-like DNA-binding protein
MLSETVFRSTDLPVADRFDAWRECMRRTHAPVDFKTDFSADYHAEARAIGLGEVTVWPSTFQQTIWLRTPKLVRQSDPETFHLTLLQRGQGGVCSGRGENSYLPNDFHTSDSSRPYEVWAGPGMTTIVGVEVPKALLPVPRNKADQAVGRPMSGREGVGALLAQFLTRLAADTSPYRPADAPRLGSVLLDLVAALFAHTLEAENDLPPETRTHTLMLRIKAFIHQHLGDLDLTPDAIAAAHHISRSHLYSLCKAGGVTVADYIRRQRLEGARADLANPALHTTPVHAVAARWGFRSAADFSRAFRTTYAVTPTQYRRLALTNAAT